MWYGYAVSSSLKGVTSDWNIVRNYKALYPYIKFRKFRDKEQALLFVKYHGRKDVTISATKYGTTFKKHYVGVEYFITDSNVYYNIRLKDIGYLKLFTEDENISVEHRHNLIMVQIRNINLNNNLISNHLIAIYQILDLIGNYIDVDIVVPDHSIFYTLTQYKGKKATIYRVLNYIKDRDGEVSITLK